MSFKTNLRGQVRQTRLPESKPLLPLFEAVINAFQAIQDAPDRGEHHVIIDIERDHGLGFEERPPITAFKIIDTGVGFSDDNFDSFNTAYSEYKFRRGGKGLGRFIWLKAFEHVEIESIFRPSGEETAFQRAFRFDDHYDPDNALPKVISSASTGTMVRLAGFREPYRSKCPQTGRELDCRAAD